MSFLISTILIWGRRNLAGSFFVKLNLNQKIKTLWNCSLVSRLIAKLIREMEQIRNVLAANINQSYFIRFYKEVVQESCYIRFVRTQTVFFIGLVVVSAIVADLIIHYAINYAIPFLGLKTIVAALSFLSLVWYCRSEFGTTLLHFKVYNSVNAVLTVLLGTAFGFLAFEQRGALAVAVLLLLLVTALIWQRPVLGLFFFILFLPLHHMIMTFLSEQLFINDLAIVLFKSWKDWIILVLAAKSFTIVLTENKTIKLGWIDFWMMAFLAINVFDAFQQMGQDNHIGVVHSLRLNLFFIACFYFGKIFDVTKKEIITLLLALAGVGGCAALLCIPEKIWMLSDLWVSLGYVDYLRNSFDQIFPTPNGLPYTFWLEGYTVRRMGSFFLGPIDLAYALLLVIPATIMLFSFFQKSKLRYVMILLVVLQLFAIGVALSRAAIAGICIEMAVVSFYFRKQMSPYIWRFLGITYIILFGIFIIHDLSGWLSRTATFQEASAAGHMTEWKEGIKSLSVKEKGYGLGTAGFMGARFNVSVTGENQYLIIGVELGILGLLIFLMIKLSVFLKLLSLTKINKDDVYSSMSFVAIAILLGIVLVGLTSQVYLNNFLIFITWWLIGILVQKGTVNETRN